MQPGQRPYAGTRQKVHPGPGQGTRVDLRGAARAPSPDVRHGLRPPLTPRRRRFAILAALASEAGFRGLRGAARAPSPDVRCGLRPSLAPRWLRPAILAALASEAGSRGTGSPAPSSLPTRASSNPTCRT